MNRPPNPEPTNPQVDRKEKRLEHMAINHRHGTGPRLAGRTCSIRCCGDNSGGGAGAPSPASIPAMARSQWAQLQWPDRPPPRPSLAESGDQPPQVAGPRSRIRRLEPPGDLERLGPGDPPPPPATQSPCSTDGSGNKGGSTRRTRTTDGEREREKNR